MNEHEILGCPAWFDRASYDASENWSEKRWRWEFLRRKTETRIKFHFLLEDDWKASFPGVPMPDIPLLHERYRDIRFYLDPGSAASIGLSPLLNPCYGHANYWDNEAELWESLRARTLRPGLIDNAVNHEAGGMSILPVSGVAITFCLGSPIGPQLEGLKKYLEGMQHPTRRPNKRLHHSKKLTYLRVLDAAEQGATLSEIAGGLLTRSTAATPQTARDVIDQAKRYQASL